VEEILNRSVQYWKTLPYACVWPGWDKFKEAGH